MKAGGLLMLALGATLISVGLDVEPLRAGFAAAGIYITIIAGKYL
jgi:hypothetical protein